MIIKTKLNVPGLINHVCGLSSPRDINRSDKILAAQDRINECNLPEIQAKGIEKWFERDTIATGRLLDLHVMTAHFGAPLNLYDFIESVGGEPLDFSSLKLIQIEE